MTTDTRTHNPAIVWLDIETGGLAHTDPVLEIAIDVTRPVRRKPFVRVPGAAARWVIDHSRDRLRLSAWAWEQHTKSGLLAEVFGEAPVGDGATRCDIHSALAGLRAHVLKYAYPERRVGAMRRMDEPEAACFVQESYTMEERPRLGGANVGPFDRAVLRHQGQHYTWLDTLFHYRTIDTSVLREFWRLCWPDVPPPEKADTHRAMDDIDASLAMATAFAGAIGCFPVPDVVRHHEVGTVCTMSFTQEERDGLEDALEALRAEASRTGEALSPAAVALLRRFEDDKEIPF